MFDNFVLLPEFVNRFRFRFASLRGDPKWPRHDPNVWELFCQISAVDLQSIPEVAVVINVLKGTFRRIMIAIAIASFQKIQLK